MKTEGQIGVMTFTLVIKLFWAFIIYYFLLKKPGYKGQGKGHKFSGVLRG